MGSCLTLVGWSQSVGPKIVVLKSFSSLPLAPPLPHFSLQGSGSPESLQVFRPQSTRTFSHFKSYCHLYAVVNKYVSHVKIHCKNTWSCDATWNYHSFVITLMLLTAVNTATADTSHRANVSSSVWSMEARACHPGLAFADAHFHLNPNQCPVH